MADYKLQTGVAQTSAITTGLDTLTSGSRALSGAIDNSSNLNILMDLELKVKYGSITGVTAGQTVTAEVYLVPTFDGTNYAEAGSSVTPQPSLLVASFITANPATGAFEYLAAIGIPIPIGSFKLLLVNKCGQSFAGSGNILSYRTYKYQSV